ncbi:hypothetical protein [Nostoc sp.]
MSLGISYIILGTLFEYLQNHAYKEHRDFGINPKELQSWYLTANVMKWLNASFHASWYMVCESDHFSIEIQPNGWCILSLYDTEDYIVKEENDA